MEPVVDGVTETLARDHERIDELIRVYRAVACGAAGPREALAEVARALRAHIDWEETVLFPVFADRDGEEAAVCVDGMRRQHVEILRLLEDAGGCPPERPDERRLRDESFVQALAEHNSAEEQTIYPWIDGLLGPEEAASLARRFP